jgi:predicted methyltransferase
MIKLLHFPLVIVWGTMLVATVAQADDAGIAAAIANDSRTAEHRERDARSKPEVILGLLDLQPGQVAADLMGGGGYYAELMAGVVGPEGMIVLHNNTPYSKFVEKQLQERYVDNEVPGIELLMSEVDDLQLAPNSLDAALMVMSYHDLHYYNPERGWSYTNVPAFFAQVRVALKPGGKLLIVDHSAKEGTGKSSAHTIHRIDANYAREEIEAGGFRFVTSSDALSNPDDERTKMVFDKSVRGKTDRFILLFEKS